jgi:hypothetical protein
MHLCRRHFSRSFGRVLLLLAVALLGTGGGLGVQAQHLDHGIYAKFGAGLSDYAGDLTARDAAAQGRGVEGNVLKYFPLVAAGELGYQFSPAWALALGGQAGSYASVGDATPSVDSYRRYTSYLLGRYTFGGPGQRVSFYLDAGLSATAGGAPGTNMGLGPSLGGGIDIRASRAVSVYVESRLNVTVPDDAVDGVEGPLGGDDRSFDTLSQPLSFGIRFSLTTPTAPEITALDAPAEVEAGTPVTFTATVNEDEAARPLRRRWTFGDGAEKMGPTVTHTYGRPGTYTVAVSVSNEAGEATESRTIRVTRAEEPSDPEAPWGVSLSASPNPVLVGEPVQFRTVVEGEGPFAYRWTFGDDTADLGPEPTYAFERPGWHPVRVRVSNEGGTETLSMKVHVERRASRASRRSEQSSRTWAIGVASMRDQAGAQEMARRYRNRLPDALMSVRIVQDGRDPERYHRVVVGRYETEEAARQARRRYREALPAGAWLVPIR